MSVIYCLWCNINASLSRRARAALYGAVLESAINGAVPGSAINGAVPESAINGAVPGLRFVCFGEHT